MKATISIVPSQRQRSIYITKEAAGDGKGIRAKLSSFFFFSNQHFVAGLSL